MSGIGYYSGSITLPAVIDKIANELLAVTSTHWSNGDATWSAGKRCCKYTDGAEVMYVALEMINTTNGVDIYIASSNYNNAKGLKVTFSDAWASNAPSGNTQVTFIQFEARNGTTAILAYVAGDLTTMLITYNLWIEDNGFALMGTPAANTTDNRQGAFIAVVERMVPANKEYVDGYTNFFGYFRCNYYEYNNARNASGYDGKRAEIVMRPFRYVAHPNKEYASLPNNAYISVYTEINKSWEAATFGHIYNPIGIEFPKLAIKSSGNGKVYYVKPIVHNSISSTGFRHEMSFDPIYLSELFIAWRPDGGLIDGDIIAVTGVTKKYLLKAINSADSAVPLYYGIKYNV